MLIKLGKNVSKQDVRAFAAEETVAEIAQTEQFQRMAVYSYYGSVAEINGCMVVKLGE